MADHPSTIGPDPDPELTAAGIRHRQPDERCALCGQPAGEPCRNVFTSKFLALDWMHFQPVRRDVAAEHRPVSAGALQHPGRH